MDALASRRQALQRLGSAVAALALPLPAALAQTTNPAYPVKPVRVLVGAAPGGPADFLARLFSDAATPALGQPFVVDNRAGASGTIAAAIGAKVPADGHTLMAGGPAAMVAAPHLFARLDYDADKDFTPVAMLGAGAFVLAVHPSVPAKDLTELIAHARRRPGALNYGSGGNGSSGHLCSESFAAQAGASLQHVPYKGDGPAFNDLLAGQIQMMFTAPNVALPHLASGKLRVLAVTSLDRITGLPEVPSVHETLADFEYLGWIVLFAPAATPPAVIDALAGLWSRARTQSAVKAKLEGLGMYPPARFAGRDALLALLEAEKARTARLVKTLGITPA